MVVVGYGWGDPYINARIGREVQIEPNLLVVDVSLDAADRALRDPVRNVASIFIGGGTKAALSGGRVQVLDADGSGTTVDGGLAGAFGAIGLTTKDTSYYQPRHGK